jgi:hypothetical protein
MEKAIIGRFGLPSGLVLAELPERQGLMENPGSNVQRVD